MRRSVLLVNGSLLPVRVFLRGVFSTPCTTTEREISDTNFGKMVLDSESSQIQRNAINDQRAISVICDLLRKGNDWDSLSTKLGHIELSDSMVQDILLQLKNPSDAKKGLSFFHWSSLRKNFKHSVRSYCIIAQVLLHAGLGVHSLAMLESVVSNNSDCGSRYRIAECLLSTYSSTCSSPKVFDLLIQTCAKLRKFDEAISSYLYLQEHGFLPTISTWNALLDVIQRSEKNLLVWRVYEDMITMRTFPNTVTTRIMIDALCKQGSLQKIVNLLDHIDSKRCIPGVIVNTALAILMFDDERVDEGMSLLKKMFQKNMIVDRVYYSLTIYGLCMLGNLEHALAVYDEILRKGYPMNSLIFTSFIGVHSRNGNFQEFYQLIQEMLKEGLKPYGETFDLLMEGCCRVGKLEHGIRFFQEMLHRNLLPSTNACNELLGKICDAGDTNKANSLLTTAIDKGFVPDEVTYVQLIHAYCEMNNVEDALKLYYEMVHRGPDPGSLTYSLLVRCLCRWGKYDKAEKILNVMKDKGLIPSTCTYNTIIKGCCMSNDTRTALCLYDDMIKNGVKPNSHTYAALAEGMNRLHTFRSPEEVLISLIDHG